MLKSSTVNLVLVHRYRQVQIIEVRRGAYLRFVFPDVHDFSGMGETEQDTCPIFED